MSGSNSPCFACILSFSFVINGKKQVILFCKMLLKKEIDRNLKYYNFI